jgi:hypothetical protein
MYCLERLYDSPYERSDTMSDASGGGEHKKSPSQKVWSGVGTTISVLVGLLVLGFVILALAPMALNAFNDAIGAIGNALSNTGRAMMVVGMNISIAMSGFFRVFIQILIYAILFFVGVWIFQQVLKKLKGGDDHHGGGGGGHH